MVYIGLPMIYDDGALLLICHKLLYTLTKFIIQALQEI